MPYATVAELRARYTRDGQDPFAEYADADLAQALASASAEIDSWCPQITLGTAALAVLNDKCLTMSRLAVYGDSALDATHPIVRDALAVRDWLKALSRGQVLLPADATAGTQRPGMRVRAPAATFSDDLMGRF